MSSLHFNLTDCGTSPVPRKWRWCQILQGRDHPRIVSQLVWPRTHHWESVLCVQYCHYYVLLRIITHCILLLPQKRRNIPRKTWMISINNAIVDHRIWCKESRNYIRDEQNFDTSQSALKNRWNPARACSCSYLWPASPRCASCHCHHCWTPPWGSLLLVSLLTLCAAARLGIL